MNTNQTRRQDYSSIGGEQEFFATPLLRKSIDDSLARIGNPIEGARVLDIGAGECPLRGKLEDAGYKYESLDIEQNDRRTIDYVARIDRSLPDPLFAQGKYDLLVLTEVLEHVPDWAEAFENLGRLLKIGGHCIITTPFFYMLHEEPFDFWRPTDHALRHFAISHGFNVTHSQRNGDGWDVLGTLLCCTSVCRRRKNIVGYLFLIPALLLLKVTKFIFKSRVLQGMINLQMRYYLGNYFILKKVTD